MKSVAFALLLLMVGCVPGQTSLMVERPSVRFLLESGAPGHYTVFVFVNQPSTIRRLSVQGEDLAAPDDPTCRPYPGLPGGMICAEGAKIRAAPGGYRLNLTGPQEPVGNICVVHDGVLELLLCNDLKKLPFPLPAS
ncbi:MAG: hypothetical protein AVDCRST_MAG86-3270 [uncultured Truepera sp.]|uniref:Lipoprotein n=1 Tax=uncultured Truepera sp. TaxID=543023 RepID=A0A6J4VNB3_9DEIN|nr:MAG: hypothetical protein AVDCRST_MAG86-3270 [uncultured Truepera sp.]